MSGMGRCFEFFFGSRTDAGFTHDPGHTVSPAPDAVIDKIPMDSGCTVTQAMVNPLFLLFWQDQYDRSIDRKMS